MTNRYAAILYAVSLPLTALPVAQSVAETAYGETFIPTSSYAQPGEDKCGQVARCGAACVILPESAVVTGIRQGLTNIPDDHSTGGSWFAWDGQTTMMAGSHQKICTWGRNWSDATARKIDLTVTFER